MFTRQSLQATYTLAESGLRLAIARCRRSDRAPPRRGALPERVAGEPLAHHDREQQEQVQVGEEEQREPPALVLGAAGEFRGEPDQAPPEDRRRREGQGPADVER